MSARHAHIPNEQRFQKHNVRLRQCEFALSVRLRRAITTKLARDGRCASSLVAGRLAIILAARRLRRSGAFAHRLGQHGIPSVDAGTLLQELESLPFTSGLSPKSLEQIAAAASLLQAPAGEVLFREGDHHPYSYLVHSGLVGIELHGPPHGAIRMLTLGPGDLVGWSPLCGQNAMNARAICVTDAELFVLDAEKLRTAFDDDPRVGYEVMRQVALSLARRLVATRMQLLDVYRSEAPQIPEPTDVD